MGTWMRRYLRWPTASTRRGLLIAGYLLGLFAYGVPLPRGLHARASDPVVRDELLAWSQTLRAVGLSVEPQALGDTVRRVGGALDGVRYAITAPFGPVFRMLGWDGNWALFAVPDTHPYFLEIVALPRDQPAAVLFRSASERDEDRAAITYRRVRAMMNPGASVPPTFWAAADWLGKRAGARHPEVEAFEVRLKRRHTTPPRGEPTTSTETVVERHRVGKPRLSAPAAGVVD